MVRREWRHDPPERPDLPRQDAGPDLYRRPDGDLSRLPWPRPERGSDQARARAGVIHTSYRTQPKRGAFELPVFMRRPGMRHYLLSADRETAYPSFRQTKQDALPSHPRGPHFKARSKASRHRHSSEPLPQEGVMGLPVDHCGRLAAAIVTGIWSIGVFAAPPAQGPTQAELDGGARATDSWLMTNKSYDGARYVTLDQITRKNVATLKPVCT